MLNILSRARIPVTLAVLAALAGCSPGAAPGILVFTASPSAPASSASEPAWGKGWVGAVEDLQPVLRPDAAANERLADRMAAAAPYRWTGVQAGCLNRLWTRISKFDNFYANDLFNGIAGLAGSVTDPATPADPTLAGLQAAGWFSARPDVQIAEGLADTAIFWDTPCQEWASDQGVPPGSYPLPGDIPDPGWHGQAGTLDFDVTGGRLALTPETLQDLCGVPGKPAAFPLPACARITQATTWPVS